MSATLAVLKTRFYTRLRADQASPAASDVDVDDTSLTTWFNEALSEVIHALKNPAYFQELLQKDSSLTFAGGYEDLPTDFEILVSATAGTGKIKCWPIDITEFNGYDSGNFLTTPKTSRPIVTLANGRIYIKPTSYTSGYLDYIKKHPDLSGSQDTVWANIADNLIVEKVLEKYCNYQLDSGKGEFASLMTSVMNKQKEIISVA